MICKKDIIADMHTHTVASLHAYSTLEELMHYAELAGMRYIGITDHYFHNGDDLINKNEVSRIKYMELNVNKVSENIKVISSAEFNFLQDKEYQKKLSMLKWRPIGLHKSFAPGLKMLNYDELFEDFKNAAEWNTAFNHIERELDKLCYGKFTDSLPDEAKKFLEKVVLLAGEKNIFLEINEHSLESDRGYDKIVRYWMDIAVENGNRFCLGTDAHFCRETGLFEKSIALLNSYGIDKSRVLNCDEDEVKKYLRKP